MKLLIDGDAIIYKVGFATEGRTYTCPDGQEFKYKKDALKHCKEPVLSYNPEEISFALHSAKMMLKSFFALAETEEHIIYLKNEEEGVIGFRQDIDENYKSSRKDSHKPYHADNIREYLEKNYTTEQAAPGLEVDDMLGIFQTDETCIVSHDKDLLMIPGDHIHIEFDSVLTPLHIGETEGLKAFYSQCLTGDKVDDIPGIHGIGKKTAEKLLAKASTAADMNEIVETAYIDKKIPLERLEMNKQLLWIKRDKKDLYTKTMEMFPTKEEGQRD